MTNLRLAIGVLFITALCGPGVAAETGTIRVRILDENGQAMSARAWVDDSSGRRHHIPTAPESCTPYVRDRSFSCDGWFELSAPAGRITVHVERGKEFIPVDKSVVLSAETRVDLDITLVRWVNMPERGYYSGDLHVHFGHDNLAVLKQLSLADDVHVVPAFSYWLRGTEPAWKSDWPEWEGGERIRVDDRHFVTRGNLEIERISATEIPGGSLGASFIYHLNKPVTAPRFDIRFPSDAMLGQKAKERFPACIIDTDKPSWADTVVGAAFGIYDVAQVCHNHYHRLATLPGGWGMIGPLAAGERDLKEKDELFHRTNIQYYHFLNCGIRLGVSGGSAMGVMPVPLGYSRTYAQVRGEFTPDAFWAAVRAGRTFATSGPMLTLEVNGQGMGASLAFAAAELRPLRISAHVQSLETIHSLELIENGQVIHREAPSAPANGKPLDEVFEFQVQPKRSGWFAARALFLAPDGGLRQAHTSPIYVKIDGKPIAFLPSAEYMLRWLDRLVEIAEMPGRYREAGDRQAILNSYHEARTFYLRVITDAKAAWGE